MEEKRFDVAVLGSGPGGYPAAIRLAQKGLKVALIEAKEVGGTCLNRGCIPTKALIANAEVLHSIRRAQKFGIQVQGVELDFSNMQKSKDEAVTRLRNSLEGLIQANGISLIRGRGTFISANQIKVQGKDNCVIWADNIIIATGSEPREIAAFAFDGTLIHSSTSILALEKLPASMAIVGGGVIGCEFASLYAELGVKVTLIEALERILPLECSTISTALNRSFQKRGIEILTSSPVQAIEKRSNGVTVRLQGDKNVEADIALVAIGRALNSDSLGLEAAGVIVKKGSIEVDDEMRTNVPGIYAIGDVSGKTLYAHTATHQGFVAVSNILGEKARMNYDAVPGVIFTIPEIGSCGLCLEEAKKRGYNAKLSSYPMQALGKAQVTFQTEGFAQLVVDADTGQILGAQVVGHEAGNLLAPITLAITNELTVESITETIHAHPTLSEAWMESAFIAEGMPLHWLQPSAHG
ncbi:MAG: dihydrolipoyl dehydrogenase [Verrucomicrobia bacterium]|nr:dihydrolipoyl dehydrogenase [Verrucomicrobiota bacterium]